MICSARATGIGRSRIAFTMLKIVVLAAIPNANVTIATNVNPGDFRSVRNPNRTSCKKLFISSPSTESSTV